MKKSSIFKMAMALICVCLIGVGSASAQEKSGGKKAEEAFVAVEESAEFPGGIEGLSKYIGEHMKYPKKAKKKGFEGKVFVQFIVEKDGSVSNVKVVRDPGYGCGKAAKKVVKGMPKWTPAKQQGKAVRCLFTLPIKFALK